MGGFARTGTHFASKWGAYSDFSLSAVRIYDDIAEPFSGFYTTCSSSNLQASTVHCSVEDTVNKTLHIVALNKNLDSTVTAYFNITSNIGYDSINVYWFDKTSPTIHSAVLPDSVVHMNVFQQTLNPGSVYHFVLHASNSTTSIQEQHTIDVKVYPNPVSDMLQVQLNETTINGFKWNVIDMTGKMLMSGETLYNQTTIPVYGLAKGNYQLYIYNEKYKGVKTFIKQ